jgi:hypothetical protein
LIQRQFFSVSPMNGLDNALRNAPFESARRKGLRIDRDAHAAVDVTRRQWLRIDGNVWCGRGADRSRLGKRGNERRKDESKDFGSGLHENSFHDANVDEGKISCVDE